MPRALTSRLIVLPNSGIKRRFFWRFGYFRTLPVGLNLVARVRLEYPPPTIEPFLVMAHTFFIIFLCYHITHMDATNAIFYIAILIMSIVIHEVSHGFMAEYFGDNTARSAGRLTLNPIRHLGCGGRRSFQLSYRNNIRDYYPRDIRNVIVARLLFHNFGNCNCKFSFGNFQSDSDSTARRLQNTLFLFTRVSLFLYVGFGEIWINFTACFHYFLCRISLSGTSFSFSFHYRITALIFAIFLVLYY